MSRARRDEQILLEQGPAQAVASGGEEVLEHGTCGGRAEVARRWKRDGVAAEVVVK